MDKKVETKIVDFFCNVVENVVESYNRSRKEEMEKYTLGIDFGTRKTKASLYKDGDEPIIVFYYDKSDKLGRAYYCMSTALYYVGTPTVNDEYNEQEFDIIYKYHGFLIGDRAHNAKLYHKGRYFENFKPSLSENTSDNHIIDDPFFTKEHLTAIILQYYLVQATTFLKEHNPNGVISRAVLTLPSNSFVNDYRWSSMQKAVEYAGFNEMNIPVTFLKEPEAAGYYLLLKHKILNGVSSSEGKRYLIYDFGGGTFDCTLFRVENSVVFIELSSENSNLGKNIGGIYIDEKIRKRLIQQNPKIIEVLSPSYNGSLSPEEKASFIRVLRDWPVAAKHALSDSDNFMRNDDDLGISFSLSRDDFESDIESIIDDTIDCCDELLQSNNTTWNDIDAVFMVGGSSSIPLAVKKLEQKQIINKDLSVISNLDYSDRINCVASGAAMYEHLRPTSSQTFAAGISRREAGDYYSAEHFFQLSAFAGNKDGLYEIGRLYYLGRIGIRRTQKQLAREYFERADTDAANFMLAKIYFTGTDGVRADIPKCKSYLDKCPMNASVRKFIRIIQGSASEQEYSEFYDANYEF